jgi:aquaporin Z
MIDIITEFIGTFFFISVILSTNSPLYIGIALTTVIAFGGNNSGGHFNPAVSTVMLLKKTISLDTWMKYVLAQVLGGIVALYYTRASER